jgi:predicted RNA binding protein YcfA (HicA-like mRNA interferase family)
MTRLPRPTGKQVIAALGKVGFEVARVRGSHHFLRHADGRAIVVPVHAGETIGPGLMTKILRATELTVDEFSVLLGQGPRQGV